jgi:hypothetical protein
MENQGATTSDGRMDAAVFVLSAFTRLIVSKDGCSFNKRSFKTKRIREVKVSFAELFLIILTPLAELRRRFDCTVDELAKLSWIELTQFVSVTVSVFQDKKYACMRLIGRNGVAEQFVNLSEDECNVFIAKAGSISEAIGTFFMHDECLEESDAQYKLLKIADSVILHLMNKALPSVRQANCPGCGESQGNQMAHFGYCMFYCDEDEREAKKNLFDKVFVSVDKDSFNVLLCEFIWKYQLNTCLDLFNLYVMGGPRREMLKVRFVRGDEGQYRTEIQDILAKRSLVQLIQTRK